MQKGFYLQIKDGPYTFLLARDETVSVEPRARLQSSSKLSESGALAWFVNSDQRWPVFRLADILGYDAGDWGQAVFIRNGESVIGLAAEQTRQLAEPYALDIQPYTVIGSRFGGRSIYSGVCVDGGEAMLVFDGRGLTELAERVAGK